MYIPAGRDRVEILGRQGIYLVLDVNREEGFARVIPRAAKEYWAEDVPFSLLRPYKKMDAAPKTR